MYKHCTVLIIMLALDFKVEMKKAYFAIMSWLLWSWDFTNYLYEIEDGQA